ACVEESYNWDRLSIGDLVNIIHPILGIKVQAKISQIDYDFEGETIQVGITNATRLLSDEQKFIESLYNSNRTSTDYNNRKIDWQKTSYNFNSRNDRISETPIDPTFNNDVTDITHTKNDDGSVTLTVNWNYPTDITVNENNIDGFNIYLYASNKVESITLGSMGGNNESIINMNADARKCTIPSVPANLYYYVGVQAYRDVDNDINSNGIILSNIVKSTYTNCYPYQPETTVDVQGKLNGIRYTTSDTEPTEPPPQINDEWTDTTTHTKKIYTSTGWQVINTDTAATLGGYEASATITPSTIPIRDSSGNIPGSITGSSQYLNGKSDTDFAQLTNGKVSTTILPINYTFGNYTGDGTGYRKITLGFTPRIVRIYTTNTSDISVYINSTSGGYKLNTSTSSVVLVGLSDGTPYSQFGKLTTNGFLVAQDINLYSNKNGILYYYEAFL
ncbi:MAG: hypothetical protein Q8880_13570, partial [Bacteroidota bacterium]|nr:hypothetical protein [Bacteroidota bacterium]